MIKLTTTILDSSAVDMLSRIADYVETGLLVVFLILVIIDIYLYMNKEKWSRTFSNVVKEWINTKYFFIIYLWGVLTGHFFFGTTNPIFESTIGSLAIVLSGALILFLSKSLINKKTRESLSFKTFLIIVGIGVGHFFWSLNY